MISGSILWKPDHDDLCERRTADFRKNLAVSSKRSYEIGNSYTVPKSSFPKISTKTYSLNLSLLKKNRDVIFQLDPRKEPLDAAW